MTTSTTIPDPNSTPAEDADLVELHWMTDPDLAMHIAAGVSVPALCGAWIEPDEQLATTVTTAGLGGPRYVSCRACDTIHARNQQA